MTDDGWSGNGWGGGHWIAAIVMMVLFRVAGTGSPRGLRAGSQ